jgi:hypothetical protein
MSGAETRIPWLPPRAAVARVARHLGCTPEAAELQIVGKGKAGLIRALGAIADRLVSPLPAAWNGAVDLTSATMKPPEVSYLITNLELCFGDLVAAGLLTTTALGRAWWSAAEALAWIIIGVPLALKEWTGLHELGSGAEQAGKELAEIIGEDWVPAQGRNSLQGPMEQIPGSDLRIPGFTWVVRPHGDLGTSPPGRLAVFEGRRWYGIEVDAAALRQARSRPAVPEPAPPPPQVEPEPPPPEPEPAKAEFTRGKRDPVIEGMRAFYPPDGIRPKSVSIAALTKRINKLPEFKASEVSEDTVRLADIEIKEARKK